MSYKKSGGRTKSSSFYDYDYGDFYGYGGGSDYRKSTIGFGTSKSSGSSWYSGWFSETSSRERVKPQLSYWLKKDCEDTFLDTFRAYEKILRNYASVEYQDNGEPIKETFVSALLHHYVKLLQENLEENRYGVDSIDYVMLYDIFKLHYYTLKELNFTETSSPYMKLILNFLNPYSDAGGKGFSVRSKALKQSSLDFLKVIISLLLRDIKDLIDSNPNSDVMQMLQSQKGVNLGRKLSDPKQMQDLLDSLTEDDFLNEQELEPENLNVDMDMDSSILDLEDIFKDLEDSVNNRDLDQIFENLLEKASSEGLDASVLRNTEGYTRNTLEGNLRRGGAGTESDLKKTAARKIDKLKVNHKKLSNLMSTLTKSMEQSGGITVRRIQQSIYDADTLDCMLELENLSPKLKKLTNFDPEVEEVFKKGTVDFYLDISGSMSQSQIDSGLSMIIQLHALGYLGNIYLFESELVYLGKNLDLLPFVTSCGGTSFYKVHRNVLKRGRTSIVYTDGDASLSEFNPDIYFVGCKGSRFTHISSDYLSNSRAFFYDISTGDFAKATPSSRSYPF